MNEASKMYHAQLAADKAHHELRIAWLEENDNPTWSDGTPVSKSDRNEMIRSSRRCIDTEYGFNSCHCDPRCGT